MLGILCSMTVVVLVPTAEESLTVPSLDATDALLESFRPQFPGIEITARPVNAATSIDMTLTDVDAVVAAVHRELAAEETTAVVVLHTTDTMEETAVALDVFHHDVRPVILTGAQLPAEHPESDLRGNLFEALVIATSDTAQDLGVLITFAHAVLPARGALKWHTTEALAFGTNAPDDAVRPDALAPSGLAGHRVDIVPVYPGIADAAVAASINQAVAEGAEGLVVEAAGAGVVPQRVADELVSAMARGIPVVVCSRVPRGPVSPAYSQFGVGRQVQDSEKNEAMGATAGSCGEARSSSASLGSVAALAPHGAIGADYVHAPQARMMLLAALATGAHPQTLFASIEA